MNVRTDLLFYGTDLSDVLRGNLEQAKQDVEGISATQFRHSGDEDIVAHVYSKRTITPIELNEDSMEMDTEETQVDVRHDFNRAVFDKSKPCMIPGLRITVCIPFSGNANLWHCQPSSYTLNPPRGVVRATRNNEGGLLELVLERPSDTLDDGTEIRREVESTLVSIRNYLAKSRSDVEAHNKELHKRIGQCVASRRARLGTHAKVVTALGIPLRKKPGTPDMAALPIKRKLIKPLPATPPTPPEPGISDKDYEHILKVIRHEGRSFETTPQTFAKHDEEELRDIILAHLNGHYEGGASGETFRRIGKTDIRIEAENRAAFVAECKVWRGQRHLAESVDQLLGYLTWRDCKTALIVFNRQVAGFSEIESKVLPTLREHPGYVRDTATDQAGEWRIWLRDKDDAARQILVHVFLFNLYVPGKKQ